ncbi:tetratricopeptide repeat protein, partial [bacterium]|nr:tetratricopeptide repeat protein [bacterium]
MPRARITPCLLRRPLRLPELAIAALLLAGLSGCARFNTYYNAEKAFSDAEHVREERIKTGDDVTKATNVQAEDYRRTIQKCRKLLENYPGHSLSDDCLFLMGKSHHRLQEYNASIEQLDLLFTNFPATPYAEEALFLQAANHMFNGNVDRSNDYLEQLRDRFPESRFQAEALRVRGENAFALERWETASESYAAFVDTHPDDERAGEVGLDLGQAL